MISVIHILRVFYYYYSIYRLKAVFVCKSRISRIDKFIASVAVMCTSAYPLMDKRRDLFEVKVSLKILTKGIRL